MGIPTHCFDDREVTATLKEMARNDANELRPVWERFVELELCLSKGGGSLARAQVVEARMQQVCTLLSPWSIVGSLVVVLDVFVLMVVVELW